MKYHENPDQFRNIANIEVNKLYASKDKPVNEAYVEALIKICSEEDVELEILSRAIYASIKDPDHKIHSIGKIIEIAKSLSFEDRRKAQGESYGVVTQNDVHYPGKEYKYRDYKDVWVKLASLIMRLNMVHRIPGDVHINAWTYISEFKKMKWADVDPDEFRQVQDNLTEKLSTYPPREGGNFASFV